MNTDLHAEVIAIGDELTSGQRLDTNSQWISERLGEMGVRTLFHTTVADDLPSNIRAFQVAADRVDLVVCTGGLGPTADDLTRQAIAEAFDRPLQRDADALAHIQNLFARRSRPMPESNHVQADFPAGSRVIPNPHGSAPGIDLSLDRPQRTPHRIFALPGVPAEMREMWFATVGPAISFLASGSPRVIRHQRLKCFGVGESDLEKMLPDLIRRGRTPTVGITVSQATITLRVTALAADASACQELMAPTLDTIRQCLGDLVFGEEDDELQHAVARKLRERGETLAVFDWGAGGLVAHWLSEAASDEFLGGAVLRSDRAFLQRIDQGAEVLASHGAHSRQAAEAMARQVQEDFGADWGLAIGPFPVDQQDQGDVHFALAGPSGMATTASPYTGHPDILLAKAAKQALNLVRKKLGGSEG
ncbi:CinA family nicotinamide mononucleotide deamidase-related protein [Lignipirellula cremea]|uniref:CinA family nicotinamide mononucleotide deamidase-related protein n=1 Tax=Lignipirellula cremea TaxID=2528010 RepID=UPI0018D2102E|nr:CinA family nicotinamide mononucleotide deamidase-related protein [Lignipirellula cremea]